MVCRLIAYYHGRGSITNTQCVLHMVMVSYTHSNIKSQKQTKRIFPLLDPEPRSAAVFALGNRQVGKDQDFDDLFPFCKGRPCHTSPLKVDHLIVAIQR